MPIQLTTVVLAPVYRVMLAVRTIISIIEPTFSYYITSINSCRYTRLFSKEKEAFFFAYPFFLDMLDTMPTATTTSMYPIIEIMLCSGKIFYKLILVLSFHYDDTFHRQFCSRNPARTNRRFGAGGCTTWFRKRTAQAF